MAAATAYALLGRYEGQTVNGSSVQQAFPNTGGLTGSSQQNLDLLQIANPGDSTSGTPNGSANPPTIMVNVDYLGNVHNPPVNPTNGTRLGVFWSRLANGSTTQQFFADAFTNPQNLDIIQIINLGGNISYWLDYTGTANGA